MHKLQNVDAVLLNKKNVCSGDVYNAAQLVALYMYTSQQIKHFTQIHIFLYSCALQPLLLTRGVYLPARGLN
jgi:hypothetical protein